MEQFSIKENKHHLAKINEQDVLNIRLLYNENKGISAKKLAKTYKIDYSNMCKILKRKTWKHVV